MCHISLYTVFQIFFSFGGGDPLLSSTNKPILTACNLKLKLNFKLKWALP